MTTSFLRLARIFAIRFVDEEVPPQRDRFPNKKRTSYNLPLVSFNLGELRDANLERMGFFFSRE